MKTQQFVLLCHIECRHLSIFPGSCPPSIVDANELNYCVRKGNRWTLVAIGTDSIDAFRQYCKNALQFLPYQFSVKES